MTDRAPVRTTCPYCGVGCGILATPDGTGGLTIKGDPDHPANRGRLCSKGSALGETMGLQDRLLTPRVDGREVGWDDALGLVARRFKRVIAEHGPEAVALYVSGQMLTEDCYVANKLMKGFIGTANIDTNSRLCMASSVAGHRRAFGSDTVPGLYEDLELADFAVLTGSNLAWCHPVPYQRLAAARAARPAIKVVVIDPRRTATCDLADLHLAVAPGSDAALFNALLVAIDKAAAVALQRFAARWYGFAVSVAEICPKADHWAKSRIRNGWRIELAGLQTPPDWLAYAGALFSLPQANPSVLTDRAKGLVRLAFYDGERLIAALFAGPDPVALSRDHLAAQISAAAPGQVLAGVPGAGQPDPGPVICACLNVGRNTILTAIASGAARSVTEIGVLLGAGGSCGSCRPELNALLSRFRMRQAAEGSAPPPRHPADLTLPPHFEMHGSVK